ncbi:hypothetical protein FRB96_005389 [Tulasnella sp. 330]|nr:hypothetical protein FRB96_005389 [Tulasnella sp. 330]KAG8883019.1 hypothetical protein FRB97_007393 [Tulasnella sp. 331]KAG8888514.1 hypothetical protein FRB98_007555 [Tulasnella sp. 332]
MRSTLLVTFFTLFFATLSFARINSMSAPATVKKGSSFKVAFQTGITFDENVDYAMVLSFSKVVCDSCFGTFAGAFDLVTHGHSLTGASPFSETIQAPTTPGVYYITASMLYIVEGEFDNLSLRFLPNVRITVTN